MEFGHAQVCGGQHAVCCAEGDADDAQLLLRPCCVAQGAPGGSAQAGVGAAALAPTGRDAAGKCALSIQLYTCELIMRLLDRPASTSYCSFQSKACSSLAMQAHIKHLEQLLQSAPSRPPAARVATPTRSTKGTFGAVWPPGSSPVKGSPKTASSPVAAGSIAPRASAALPQAEATALVRPSAPLTVESLATILAEANRERECEARLQLYRLQEQYEGKLQALEAGLQQREGGYAGVLQQLLQLKVQHPGSSTAAERARSEISLHRLASHTPAKPVPASPAVSPQRPQAQQTGSVPGERRTQQDIHAHQSDAQPGPHQGTPGKGLPGFKGPRPRTPGSAAKARSQSRPWVGGQRDARAAPGTGSECQRQVKASTAKLHQRFFGAQLQEPSSPAGSSSHSISFQDLPDERQPRQLGLGERRFLGVLALVRRWRPWSEGWAVVRGLISKPQLLTLAAQLTNLPPHIFYLMLTYTVPVRLLLSWQVRAARLTPGRAWYARQWSLTPQQALRWAPCGPTSARIRESACVVG